MEARLVEVSRKTIYDDRGNFALDKRLRILYEFLRYICAILRNPVTRNETLIVSDTMHILNFGRRLVRVVRSTYDYNHLTGIAFVCSHHSGTTYVIRFHDVDTACQVACGTL